MNICLVIPHVTGLVKGGVRFQAVMMANYLKKRGLNVILYNPWNPPDWSSIDLVHLFQANSAALQFSRMLSDYKVPYVITPVTFSNHSPTFVRISRTLEYFVRPLLKSLPSTYRVIYQICDGAARVLPNTKAEARLIEKGYQIDVEKIRIIPNGVEERFASATAEHFKQKYNLENFILFVGNIGTKRKNALRLIQALEDITHPAVLAGPIHDNKYARRCRAIANRHTHIHLIGPLEHNGPELASAYAGAKLFVLPSYFETPGIAALEAALCGNPIVITPHGGTREYFGNNAVYINPTSVTSIKNGIKKGLNKAVDPALKKHILNNYTWGEIARKTCKTYQELLNH